LRIDRIAYLFLLICVLSFSTPVNSTQSQPNIIAELQVENSLLETDKLSIPKPLEYISSVSSKKVFKTYVISTNAYVIPRYNFHLINILAYQSKQNITYQHQKNIALIIKPKEVFLTKYYRFLISEEYFYRLS
jgi:hypothetical protein